MRDTFRFVQQAAVLEAACLCISNRLRLNVHDRAAAYNLDEKKNPANDDSLPGLRRSGAGNEARTRDLNLGKVALYQLSYSRSKGAYFK